MAVGVKVRCARRVGAVLFVFALLFLAPVHAATANSGPGASPLRENEVPAYAPVSTKDHIIGRIEIPRVGVSAAILQGVDDATIRRAVGHFPETPLPGEKGNMALAAHRTTDFYGLRDIRIGDEVTITSPRGSFRYRVERTWVVSPDDVSVLDSSSDRELTLVTCYPFDYRGSAPRRFIVRARANDRGERQGSGTSVSTQAPGTSAPSN
jgi:sortase A